MPRCIVIKGGSQAVGEVTISGSKNAALPILAATLLTNDRVTLKNIPKITDVHTMIKLLQTFGRAVKTEDTTIGMTVMVQCKKRLNNGITNNRELCKKIRASILLLGPLLTLGKMAVLSYPGGCNIGTRPVDLHLQSLTLMGATIIVDTCIICGHAQNGLNGVNIKLPTPSVGATENILMAATLAEGQTVIQNAARDPEIVDLANFLSSMGADIIGSGTSRMIVNGVNTLHGCEYRVMADRIEAGSYACVAASTNGNLVLSDINPDLLELPLDILSQAGSSVYKGCSSVRIVGKPHKSIDITTGAYPNFPTDFQPQFVSLFTTTPGTSFIKENVFENRFENISQLNMLGANIVVKYNQAIVKGVDKLNGNVVQASNLRDCFALIVAASAAKGITTIRGLGSLERGYENPIAKLANLGVNIFTS